MNDTNDSLNNDRVGNNNHHQNPNRIKTRIHNNNKNTHRFISRSIASSITNNKDDTHINNCMNPEKNNTEN